MIRVRIGSEVKEIDAFKFNSGLYTTLSEVAGNTIVLFKAPGVYWVKPHLMR